MSGDPLREYVQYRVVETMLARHKPSGGERVVITAMDDAADLLTWSAQPDRVPALGTVIEVSMRRHEDDPPPDQPEQSRGRQDRGAGAAIREDVEPDAPEQEVARVDGVATPAPHLRSPSVQSGGDAAPSS